MPKRLIEISLYVWFFFFKSSSEILCLLYQEVKYIFIYFFHSYVLWNRAITEQKVRVKKLGTDLTSAQKEMKAKHKAYENAVGILSRRLQEALTDKETAEAELAKLKAQVSDEGNSQALQVMSTSFKASSCNIYLKSFKH